MNRPVAAKSAVSRMRVLALVTILAFAAVAAALGGTPAQAVVQPLVIDMGTVFPGETSTAHTTVTIAQPAHVTHAGWTAFEGPDDVVWSSMLCAPNGNCAELSTFVGSELAAGDYTLSVTVDMPMYTADTPFTVKAFGELRLTGGTPEDLATTGMSSWIVPAAGFAGTAIIAFGALLLLTRRRRSTEEQS